MKITTGILIGAIAAATVIYLLLHNKVTSLQSENQPLIAQQEEPSRDQNTVSAAAPKENNDAGISRADQDEILRLRGEAGVLRRQMNELGLVVQAETLSFQAGQLSQQAKRAAGDLVLVVRVYTKDYGNDLVLTNLDQFKTLIPGDSSTNLDLEKFEIVSSPAPWNTNWPDVIVLRERAARQTTDGRWARVYGMVDGQAVEQISVDGNFESWEKQHLMPAQTGP